MGMEELKEEEFGIITNINSKKIGEVKLYTVAS